MIKLIESAERLRKGVQEYFDSHTYAGFTKGFEIERFFNRIGGNRGKDLVVLLKGVSDEDIQNIDEEWLTGLRRIGEEHGFRVSLPIEYFTK